MLHGTQKFLVNHYAGGMAALDHEGGAHQRVCLPGASEHLYGATLDLEASKAAGRVKVRHTAEEQSVTPAGDHATNLYAYHRDLGNASKPTDRNLVATDVATAKKWGIATRDPKTGKFTFPDPLQVIADSRARAIAEFTAAYDRDPTCAAEECPFVRKARLEGEAAKAAAAAQHAGEPTHEDHHADAPAPSATPAHAE